MSGRKRWNEDESQGSWRTKGKKARKFAERQVDDMIAGQQELIALPAHPIAESTSQGSLEQAEVCCFTFIYSCM